MPIERTALEMFYCGPLGVRLRAADANLFDKIAETLSLYDLTWSPPHRSVEIRARTVADTPDLCTGSFLRCGRMLVDRTDQGLRATTTSGAQAIGHYHDQSETWLIKASRNLIQLGKLEELEDILSLVLTTGWRRAGWTPVHAAAVTKGQTCAILCAPTGGGKTTMTTALVRRAWRVLGDDKLLLRVRHGKPELAALLHTFNLHPRTREWFPEVGDLERLPQYSAWTEKRKVKVESIWKHATETVSRPTVLVLLERRADALDVNVRELRPAQVLETLLRQTVIPTETQTATSIVATVARTAAQLRGLHIQVPTDAYHDATLVGRVESALEQG